MTHHINKNLETLRPNLPPEEACLSELLELNEFQEIGPGKPVAEFYAAFTGETAPQKLITRISAHAVELQPQDTSRFSPQSSYVEGFEIAATVVVDFNAPESGVREMLNLDFVKTTEGLQLIQRQLFNDGEGLVPHYTRRITGAELSALAHDAQATKEFVIEEDAELMKLGPLAEEQAEDGTRRFHIGDILAVTTGKPTSPRSMAGIYDILGFMADDSPFSTQLGRFAEECRPYLEQQVADIIRPYSEVPMSITDRLSLYRWINEVTEKMNGDPFLIVRKINGNDHAVLDPITELELDHGFEIMQKVVKLDLNPNAKYKD